MRGGSRIICSHLSTCKLRVIGVRKTGLFWLGCTLSSLGIFAFVLLIPGVLGFLTNLMPHSRFHYYYVEDLRSNGEVAMMLVASATTALVGVWLAVRHRRSQS